MAPLTSRSPISNHLQLVEARSYCHQRGIQRNKLVVWRQLSSRTDQPDIIAQHILLSQALAMAIQSSSEWPEAPRATRHTLLPSVSLSDRHGHPLRNRQRPSHVPFVPQFFLPSERVAKNVVHTFCNSSTSAEPRHWKVTGHAIKIMSVKQHILFYIVQFSFDFFAFVSYLYFQFLFIFPPS